MPHHNDKWPHLGERNRPRRPYRTVLQFVGQEAQADILGILGDARWLRSSPSEQLVPPNAGSAGSKTHFLLERVQIEPDDIGKTALEREIRHAARELRRLIGVAAEADGDFVASPVHRNTVVRDWAATDGLPVFVVVTA